MDFMCNLEPFSKIQSHITIFDISIRPKCVSIQYHCLMYHDMTIYQYIVASLARNNSWPLAIFRPISAFGQPKSILIGHISHTFSIVQQCNNSL